MRSSQFFRVHPDVLVEYVWDQEDVLVEDYYSIRNIDTGKRSMTQNDLNGTSTNNGFSNSVLQYQREDQWIRYTDDLQESLDRVARSAQPYFYDTINLYFPDGYEFDDRQGVILTADVFDKNNNPIGLASWMYYLPEDGITEIEPVDNFFAAERVWSNKLTLRIPSPYSLSRQVEVDQNTGQVIPIEGTPNDFITSGIGISENTVIAMEFRFVNNIILFDDSDSVLYRSSNPFEFSVPSQPVFADLGLQIQESDQGAFLLISPTFSGETGIQEWIDDQLIRGNRYQIEFDVRVFEEGLQTSQQILLLSPDSDFDQPIEYAPIIKNTNTTASVEVQALFTNISTGGSFIRRAGLTLLGARAARYGRQGFNISLDGVQTIKVYQSRPSNLPFNDEIDFVNTTSLEEFDSFYDPREAFFGDTDLLNRDGLSGRGNLPRRTSVRTVRVPYPVLVDRFNLVASSDNVIFRNKVWWGLTEPLEIVLYPFDNVIGFQIARLVNEDGTPELIDLNGLTPLRFHIKSPNLDESSEIYFQAGDAIDLSNGRVVFRFSEQQVRNIIPLFESGYRQFYITTSREGSASERTVLYSGLYILYDSDEYRDRLAANISARNEELGIGQGTVNRIEQSEDDGQIDTGGDEFNQFPDNPPESGRGDDC